MDELTGTTNSETFNSSSKDTYSPQHNQRTPVQFDFQVDSDRINFTERDLGSDLIFLRKHLSPTTKSANLFSTYFSSLTKSIKKITRGITKKQSIEIAHIVNICQNDLKTFLWGWINPPLEGDEFLGFTITVGGWVLGRTSQPTAIRFIVHQTIITETLIEIPRPDVVKTHFTHIVNCGFRAVIDLTPFPDSSELLLQALFPGGTAVPFGTIKYRKYG